MKKIIMITEGPAITLEFRRSTTKKILFVHGLYLNSLCWEKWIDYYKDCGFECYAPAWPWHTKLNAGKDGCNDFHSALSVQELFDMYAFVIEHEICVPPIIISHGTGTIIAQYLALAGLAESCICLAPFNENKLAAMKRLVYNAIFSLRGNKKYRQLSLSHFYKFYSNTLTISDTKSFYNRYVVAENVITENNIRSAAMDPQKEAGVPFLFITGISDRIAIARKSSVFLKELSSKRFGHVHHFLSDYCHMSFFWKISCPVSGIWLTTG